MIIQYVLRQFHVFPSHVTKIENFGDYLNIAADGSTAILVQLDEFIFLIIEINLQFVKWKTTTNENTKSYDTHLETRMTKLRPSAANFFWSNARHKNHEQYRTHKQISSPATITFSDRIRKYIYSKEPKSCTQSSSTQLMSTNRTKRLFGGTKTSSWIYLSMLRLGQHYFWRSKLTMK